MSYFNYVNYLSKLSGDCKMYHDTETYQIIISRFIFFGFKKMLKKIQGLIELQALIGKNMYELPWTMVLETVDLHDSYIVDSEYDVFYKTAILFSKIIDSLLNSEVLNTNGEPYYAKINVIIKEQVTDVDNNNSDYEMSKIKKIHILIEW